MKNLLDQMREICNTSELVRIWAYGYLDQAVQEFSAGKIDQQELRKMHYILTTSVEARLMELQSTERAEELRRRARALAEIAGKSADVTDS